MAHQGGKHVAVLGAVQRERADRAVFGVGDFLKCHESDLRLNDLL
jgi:hypothetical protein